MEATGWIDGVHDGSPSDIAFKFLDPARSGAGLTDDTRPSVVIAAIVVVFELRVVSLTVWAIRLLLIKYVKSEIALFAFFARRNDHGIGRYRFLR